MSNQQPQFVAVDSASDGSKKTPLSLYHDAIASVLAARVIVEYADSREADGNASFHPSPAGELFLPIKLLLERASEQLEELEKELERQAAAAKVQP